MTARTLHPALLISLLLIGCGGQERPAPLVGTIEAGPNAGLSNAGTLWNLRGALNVAALKCGEAAPDQYNAMLKAHARSFRRAQKRLEREYRRRGGDWRDAFDVAQTRLYNYTAHPRGERAFCLAARPVLAEIAQVPRGELIAFAAKSLISLDRALGGGASGAPKR